MIDYNTWKYNKEINNLLAESILEQIDDQQQQQQQPFKYQTGTSWGKEQQQAGGRGYMIGIQQLVNALSQLPKDQLDDVLTKIYPIIQNEIGLSKTRMGKLLGKGSTGQVTTNQGQPQVDSGI